MKLFQVFAILFCMLIAACSENYTPRPRGYFRIDLPEKKYVLYEPASCPFSFEYPAYAKIVRDSNPRAEPCWMNVEFPDFKGKIHLSYKEVNNNLQKFTEDARILAYKHTIKADAITETIIYKPGQGGGIKYNIEGDAASSVQFFMTDSSTNFLRGALYFSVVTQKDSLKPVIDFIEKDIDHLINTLKWRR